MIFNKKNFGSQKKNLQSQIREKWKSGNSKQATLVLNTGGTLGSFGFINENGILKLRPEPKRFFPLLMSEVSPFRNSFCPNPLDESMIESDDEYPFYYLELPNTIDSTEANLETWNELAIILFALVVARDAPFQSAVVIHGTDTLADVAAGLSFMLWNYSKRIILTGSQKPLCDVSRELVESRTDTMNLESDALKNLTLACDLAQARWKNGPELHGIWVAFADKLMIPTRIIKTHSLKDDAFDSPCRYPVIRGIKDESHLYKHENGAPGPEESRDLTSSLDPNSPPKLLAVSVHLLDFLSDALSDRLKKEPREPEIFFVNPSISVGVVHLAPGILNRKQWEKWNLEKDTKAQNVFVQNIWGFYHALIVVAYGSGNTPTYINEMLQYFLGNGMSKFCIIISKCLKGGTSEVYEAAANIESIDMNDCTVFAAYAKTVFELSRGQDIKKSLERRTRGEFQKPRRPQGQEDPYEF